MVESELLLLVGVLVLVVVEVVAWRLYKRRRAAKEARFVPETFVDDLEDLNRLTEYLVESSHMLARIDANRGDSIILHGIIAGKEAQITALAGFWKKLGTAPETLVSHLEASPRADAAEASEEKQLEDSDKRALLRYAQDSSRWAYDVIPLLAANVKKTGFKDVAKTLRTIGEAEGCHGEIARALAEGACDRDHELSLCPTCGCLYFGRRPAFCTACTQPNFEMMKIRSGILD